MTQLQRLRRIAGIAVPIVGGMVSQNVLNLVDTAMVGSLGAPALAAVSTASMLNFLSIALITGLSSGVQALAARRYGGGESGSTAYPLNTGLFLALVMGLPMGALLYTAAPWLYPLVNDDPAVIAEAVPYYRARLFGIVAVGMNYAFRGYWNAVDRSQLYMSTLVVMHTTNIVFSYCLIFGVAGAPELGALGAGVGTTLATMLGTAMYFVLGWRFAGRSGFLGHLPRMPELRSLLSLALPSSVQQVMFALGITTLFTIIGMLGTTEVAAAGVLVNLSLVAILPGMALGMAAASLVGQALGRGEVDDAYRWGWEVVGVGVVGLGLLGLPMVLAPDALLAPFLHEAEPLAHARPALILMGATLAVEAAGLVLMQAMLGAGAARTVMVLSVGLQWGLFLPTAYVVGPLMGGSLFTIWVAQAVQRGLQSVIFAALWFKRDWATVKL